VLPISKCTHQLNVITAIASELTAFFVEVPVDEALFDRSSTPIVLLDLLFMLKSTSCTFNVDTSSIGSCGYSALDTLKLYCLRMALEKDQQIPEYHNEHVDLCSIQLRVR
jgi:hypothetical protein